MNNSLSFYTPVAEDFPRLLELWEASVRATHDFLKEEDIQLFKKLIQEHELFSQVELTAVRLDDGKIAGFSGVAGNNLEMLFIDPEVRGGGIGKALLQQAVEKQGVTKVDVNEQNPDAKGFYERFGFKVVSRSETDGMGKPFPILHMELDSISSFNKLPSI